MGTDMDMEMAKEHGKFVKFILRGYCCIHAEKTSNSTILKCII